MFYWAACSLQPGLLAVASKGAVWQLGSSLSQRMGKKKKKSRSEVSVSQKSRAATMQVPCHAAGYDIFSSMVGTWQCVKCAQSFSSSEIWLGSLGCARGRLFPETASLNKKVPRRPSKCCGWVTLKTFSFLYSFSLLVSSLMEKTELCGDVGVFLARRISLESKHRESLVPHQQPLIPVMSPGKGACLNRGPCWLLGLEARMQGSPLCWIKVGASCGCELLRHADV